MATLTLEAAKADLSTLETTFHSMTDPKAQCPVAHKFPSLSAGDQISTTRVATEVKAVASENMYTCVLTEGDKSATSDCFVKFCPVIDPIDYLVGRSQRCATVPNGADNVAYVDSNCSQLLTLLGTQYGVVNAIQCYGTVVGFKKKFIFDAQDDIESLAESKYFLNGNGKHYQDIGGLISKSVEVLTPGKPPIKIATDTSDCIALNLDDLNEIGQSSVEQVYSSDNESLVSSRDSLTSEEVLSEEEETDSDSEEYEEFGAESAKIEIGIPDFPAVAVIMEKLEGTLDQLLVRRTAPMGQGELTATLLQVIMQLIAYQKAFDLTHNDLHSSNIMYARTDQKHLWYKMSGKIYKVPTFGKIWKIIDFGRAIYRYGEELFCSGSFLRHGDAYSQYNFGPCLDSSNEVVEPNPSFDLCRLGISLLDIVDYRGFGETAIGKTIEEWCYSDDDKNMLYKKNGEERYPDFKLYKMIARRVTRHRPLCQLDRKVFAQFAISPNRIKKVGRIIDLDKIVEEYSKTS